MPENFYVPRSIRSIITRERRVDFFTKSARIGDAGRGQSKMHQTTQIAYWLSETKHDGNYKRT
jgi:hypothetical protein